MASFREQIEKLGFSQKFIDEKLFSKKGFEEIENKLLPEEKIRAVACICDDPRPMGKTKTSFMRNWFAIFSDRRILFVSPTLVLGDMEEFSLPYKSIMSVGVGKWGGISLSTSMAIFPIKFTLTGEFIDESDRIVKIIQDSIF